MTTATSAGPHAGGEGETADGAEMPEYSAIPGRLDESLGKALAENTVVDEVLPEIKRRRGP